jgi:four helix bundle protein
MRLASYRELMVWQRSLNLVVGVYRVSGALPGQERFGLIAQLRRAAVSIPANIAEGHGRSTKGELLNHVSVARGSLNEARTLVEIAARLGVVHPADLTLLESEFEVVARNAVAPPRAALRALARAVRRPLFAVPSSPALY